MRLVSGPSDAQMDLQADPGQLARTLGSTLAMVVVPPIHSTQSPRVLPADGANRCDRALDL